MTPNMLNLQWNAAVLYPAGHYARLRQQTALADPRRTPERHDPHARPAQLAQADEGASSPLSLRYVVFGGEALELASLAPWIERHGGRPPGRTSTARRRP